MLKTNSLTTLQTLTPPLVIAAYGDQRLTVGFDCGTDDLTKQSAKDECDINLIMARYLKTGVLDFVNKNAPQYGDVTGYEFQAAMETVAKGKSMFAELPAAIRDEFDNNPEFFLEFVNDPENLPQMAEMGLLRPESADRILNPPPAPPEASNASV